MKKCKYLIVALLIMCLASSPIACPGASAAEEVQTALPGTVPSTIPKPAEGFKIGVSNNIIGNSWRAQWVEGIETATKQLQDAGIVNEVILVSSKGDLTTQINQINSLIQEGCHAILIDPVSDTGLAEVIRTAIGEGILTFILTDPAAYEGTTAFVFSNVGVFQPVVQHFFSMFPEEGGSYFYISGDPGQPTDTQRTDVVNEVNKRFPNIKQIAQIPGRWMASETQAAVLNMLATNQPFDGVLGQETTTEAAVAAFRSAGAELPKYLTADSTISFYRTWLKEFPELDMCGTAFGPSSGYTGVMMAARILNGEVLKPELLSPNPVDPNMKNAILFPPPYVVTRNKPTGQEDWAQVPGFDYSNTAYVSLEEAVEVSKEQPGTAILDRYLTDEEINNFFK